MLKVGNVDIPGLDVDVEDNYFKYINNKNSIYTILIVISHPSIPITL